MKLIAMVERMTDRLIGHVDAGACVPDHGCCCNPGHPHYLLNCDGTRCQRIADSRCNGPCFVG